MADFDRKTLEAVGHQREVRFTTNGRRTGKPRSVTIWISSDGKRVFIRSGGGLTRQWPQNLLKAGNGILHVGGTDVPVSTRHVSDPAEARWVTELVIRKYGPSVRRSPDGGQLTPAEQARFELYPRFT